jgi:hypothetical protein
MPRSPRDNTTGTATAIRFIGPDDQYIPGVPQGQPELDSEGKAVAGSRRPIAIGTDVTLEQAHEAVASGLYIAVGGVLEPLPAKTDETAVADATPKED